MTSKSLIDRTLRWLLDADPAIHWKVYARLSLTKKPRLGFDTISYEQIACSCCGFHSSHVAIELSTPHSVAASDPHLPRTIGIRDPVRTA